MGRHIGCGMRIPERVRTHPRADETKMRQHLEDELLISAKMSDIFRARPLRLCRLCALVCSRRKQKSTPRPARDARRPRMVLAFLYLRDRAVTKKLLDSWRQKDTQPTAHAAHAAADEPRLRCFGGAPEQHDCRGSFLPPCIRVAA